MKIGSCPDVSHAFLAKERKGDIRLFFLGDVKNGDIRVRACLILKSALAKGQLTRMDIERKVCTVEGERC